MATGLFPSILPGARETDVGYDADDSDGTNSDTPADPQTALDAGDCPWCDAGGFDDAHQHARMAHATEYDALEG